MQTIKKQDSAILINLLFYFVLSLITAYILFTYIVIQIIDIETKKQETIKLYDSITSVETSGISFEEFQALSKNMTKNSYVTEILKNITSEFYGQYLKNNTASLYGEFLDKKKAVLNSTLNKTVLTNRDKTILNVLPSYSDTNDGSLTDFKFVSYLEALSNTFNLKYSDPIGVKSIVLLKDFSFDETNKSGLETNIYYIPIKLSILVTKKDFINFLYYIEKVGNIYMENGNIKIYKDDFLNKNGRKIVLDGYNDINQINSNDYNIYENQIVDIEDIKMKNYIDASQEYRKDTPYLNFIQSTQGSDLIEAELKLKFFVKGQPNYQLESSINNILERYNSLLSKVNTKLKDTHINISLQMKLKQTNTYLKEVKKDIDEIKKDLKTKKSLNEIYKRAMSYDSIFNNIDTLLK